MALTLSANPIKNVNGIVSNVNAAKSQLPYTFARQDFQVNSSADDAGRLQIVILGAVTGILLADRLYIGGTYNLTAPVFTIAIGANTTITLDTPWVAAVGAGYANLLTGVRVDYRVIITLLNSAGTAPIYPDSLRYQTQSTGHLFVDLSGLVVPLIEELLSAFEYRINYQEYFNGALQGAPVLDGVVLAVIAYKQQLTNGGSNMATILLGDDGAGNVLQRSQTGYIHQAWRRTVSMIIDENLTTRTGSVGARFQYIVLDHNRNPVGAPLLGSTSTQVGIFQELVPDSVRAGAFLAITGMDNTGANALTDTVVLRVKPDCLNPIMVEWLNNSGAFEQHLFEVSQDVLIRPELGLTFQRPIIQDSEFANNTIGRKVNEIKQTITVQVDHLSQSEWLGMQEAKTSDFVGIYLERGGDRFVRCRIVEGLDGNYRTRQSGNSYSMSMQLELPENFDMFSAYAFESILIDFDDAQLQDYDDAILIDG